MYVLIKCQYFCIFIPFIQFIDEGIRRIFTGRHLWDVQFRVLLDVIGVVVYVLVWIPYWLLIFLPKLRKLDEIWGDRPVYIRPGYILYELLLIKLVALHSPKVMSTSKADLIYVENPCTKAKECLKFNLSQKINAFCSPTQLFALKCHSFWLLEELRWELNFAFEWW